LLPIGVVVVLVALSRFAPVGVWRCTGSGTYAYDPRREQPDQTLVSEPPEALMPSDVVAVRVEVSLNGGQTTVWTIAPDAEADSKPTRVIVLAPGSVQALAPACDGRLGRWKIVGDHALQ
jgi:hypothetical protein